MVSIFKYHLISSSNRTLFLSHFLSPPLTPLLFSSPVPVDYWEFRPDPYPWLLSSPLFISEAILPFSIHTKRLFSFKHTVRRGCWVPISPDSNYKGPIAALISHLIYSNPFPWWLPSPFGTRISALSGWRSSLIIASLENGAARSCSLIGWQGLEDGNVNHWQYAWPYFYHSEILSCQSEWICGAVNFMCH